jgi:hypothetical protein
MDLSWNGGCILPRLESMRESWVVRERFLGELPGEQSKGEREWGLRHLK